MFRLAVAPSCWGERRRSRRLRGSSSGATSLGHSTRHPILTSGHTTWVTMTTGQPGLEATPACPKMPTGMEAPSGHSCRVHKQCIHFGAAHDPGALHRSVWPNRDTYQAALWTGCLAGVLDARQRYYYGRLAPIFATRSSSSEIDIMEGTGTALWEGESTPPDLISGALSKVV